MRYALIALLMASSPAVAAECDTFTHETRPPGEITATIDEGERTLVVRTQGEPDATYTLMSAGTGLPYWDAQPVDGGGQHRMVRKYEDVLLVDMLAWQAFCE